ncbi:MAG: DUF1573 domain-containing protein, partial [Candidatus Zixiibacteriota bacterium]
PILALFTALVCLTQISMAGPMVHIPEATFSFGKVPQHVKISKTYWVKSVGDDTLKILTIVPGCGCTQIPMKDSVLGPGDSSSFEVQFSTQSYRGFITKKPYITTNAGPDNVYLEFNAEVVVDSNLFVPIRMNPYKIDVSQFTVEPRRKAAGWIVNVSDKDLEAVLDDDKGRKFETVFPKVIKAHDSAQVTVTVKEDALTEEFEQSFTFHVNDEVGSRFTLPVQRMYRIPQDSDVSSK